MPKKMSDMSEKEQAEYLVQRISGGSLGLIDLDFIKEHVAKSTEVCDAFLKYLGLGAKEQPLWFTSVDTLGDFRKATHDFPNDTMLITRGHDGNGAEFGFCLSARAVKEAVGGMYNPIDKKRKIQIKKAPKLAITVENP